MLNTSLAQSTHRIHRLISAAYLMYAALLVSPATRVRTAIARRNAVTNAHVADVSRRLRRAIASRAQQLTPEQLADLGQRARIAGDRSLALACDLAPMFPAEMARCVAAQAQVDESIACGRLVQQQAASEPLQIEERHEYQPWVTATVEVMS